MKITTIVDRLVADLGDKRRWRTYRARARALPGPYRTTTEALERYLLHAGGMAKGDRLVQMLEDLADLMERAAADQTPVRSIVGDDPVAFAEDFLSNYADGQWVNRERQRLTAAIAATEAYNTGDPT
jgi:DNA-binding ferritin-like protein (Dps family)